jgi:hypothetical protein
VRLGEEVVLAQDEAEDALRKVHPLGPQLLAQPPLHALRSITTHTLWSGEEVVLAQDEAEDALRKVHPLGPQLLAQPPLHARVRLAAGGLLQGLAQVAVHLYISRPQLR